MSTLSLILPIYNERSAVDRTLEELLGFARQHPDWEFIVVDDGSADRTAERIAERLMAEAAGGQAASNVRLLALPGNRGKGYAIQSGFAEAAGELLCFTDGDLPYSLDQVARLAEELRSADVVIGSRNIAGALNEGVAKRRQILGGGFNWLVRRLMGLPFLDTQAGLKGFRREAARRLFGRLRTYGFSFDVEVLYLARKSGYRIAEVPVRVSREHSYKTSKLKLMRDSLRMLWGLSWIRVNDALGKY